MSAHSGAAAPAAVPAASATKDSIAGTVRLDPELYLALRSRGVSYRPRKTNQAMIVEAIMVDLAQAKESPRCRSNTSCYERRRRMVRLPA
jgi:hypothetical protein